MSKEISGAHLFLKSGVWYFERRIPKDLQRHDASRKIAYSLRTRSRPVAVARSARAAQQLDEWWYHLRIKDGALPGKHLLKMEREAAPATLSTSRAAKPQASEIPDAPLFSEAVAIYLKLKGATRPESFQRATHRACGYLIDQCGDRAITAYTRADANAFRDHLVQRKLAGSSITRIFASVRAVVNFAAGEAGINLTNPFASVYYDRSAGVRARAPVSAEDLRAVQRECRRKDDPGSVREGGGNSDRSGGAMGVAIGVYDQGGVRRLQPVAEGTADDQDHDEPRRAA